jgi:hypothetical protein
MDSEPSVGRRKKDDKRKDKVGMPSSKCARLREAITASAKPLPEPKQKKNK